MTIYTFKSISAGFEPTMMLHKPLGQRYALGTYGSEVCLYHLAHLSAWPITSHWVPDSGSPLFAHGAFTDQQTTVLKRRWGSCKWIFNCHVWMLLKNGKSHLPPL